MEGFSKNLGIKGKDMWCPQRGRESYISDFLGRICFKPRHPKRVLTNDCKLVCMARHGALWWSSWGKEDWDVVLFSESRMIAISYGVKALPLVVL